jgi:hypothetical protein
MVAPHVFEKSDQGVFIDWAVVTITSHVWGIRTIFVSDTLARLPADLQAQSL